VLEAMLAALPVVATNVSSLPELGRRRGPARAAGRPPALAAAVNRVLARSRPAYGERRPRRGAAAEFSVAEMDEPRRIAVYESAPAR
jgi:glycosyltransferase involved in cell wall biosynthesis